MMHISAETIKKAVNAKARDDLVNELVRVVNTQGDTFKLDSNQRMYFFLGHTAIESKYYTDVEEDLNYSIKAMRKAWPSRFKTDESAKPFANNPQALAVHTYGGRMGNRPGTQDGWTYRGRGLKQLTGRTNYTLFTQWAQGRYADAPDFVRYPDKLLEPRWAVLSALWFWVARKVYIYADNNDIVGSTEAINGGKNGLADRTVAINKAKLVIVAAPPSEYVGDKKPRVRDEVLLEYQQKLDRIAVYKDIPEIDVGDPDGWFGPKTKSAIETFQRSTGTLKVDGVLGDETKKAIDQIIALIDVGKFTKISEDLTAKQDVVVEEVPVSIPNRLFDTLNKPLGENKTVWSYVSSYGSFVIGGIGLGYQRLENIFLSLPPVVQVTILVLLAAGVYFAIKSIQEHFRAKKGFKELTQNVAKAQQSIANTSGVPTT